jgi:hypothetical protein
MHVVLYVLCVCAIDDGKEYEQVMVCFFLTETALDLFNTFMQQRNPRGQAAAYVPPHRRRQAFEPTPEKAKSSGEILAAPASSEYSEEPSDVYSGDFAGSTLIIWGFPSDSTEPERDQLSRSLISAGGVEAWVSRTELVVAYRNPSKAAEAMHIQLNPALRRSLLVDFSGESADEAMEGRVYSILIFLIILVT